MNNHTIETVSALKTILRHGPYVWPGGYPIYFITRDGEALSFDAVRENLQEVVGSIRHKLNDGWLVVAWDINYEDNNLICAHTNESIECAYAED